MAAEGIPPEARCHGVGLDDLRHVLRRNRLNANPGPGRASPPVGLPSAAPSEPCRPPPGANCWLARGGGPPDGPVRLTREGRRVVAGAAQSVPPSRPRGRRGDRNPARGDWPRSPWCARDPAGRSLECRPTQTRSRPLATVTSPIVSATISEGRSAAPNPSSSTARWRAGRGRQGDGRGEGGQQPAQHVGHVGPGCRSPFRSSVGPLSRSGSWLSSPGEQEEQGRGSGPRLNCSCERGSAPPRP